MARFSTIMMLLLAGVPVAVTSCRPAESESDTTPEASPTAVSPAEDPAPAEISIDPNQSGEALFANVCATCHGAAGEGNRDLMAPSIAGQPDWFIAFQLEKFRDGHRGAGELTDPRGALMRTIALSLTEETIPKIAAAVAGMEPVPTTTELEGDAVRGGELFMTICAECHRFNGQGEKAFRSAPLTALPDWYIRESLRKFRARERGYSHGDLQGPKMQRISDLLGDEEITDLILHISSLAVRYPPGEERRR